uniref:Uncharacterized protein n=2 Tax=Moniliophthora roreri TaxID=221103 RepID=A0A0W0GA36_MONRR
MAVWCQMVGELYTAKYELEWAGNEADPKRIEAVDIVEVHENQVDCRLPGTRYGQAVTAMAKEKGLQDEDADNQRKHFHSSSYPPPFPAPPFNFPVLKLETMIPLHLLPQKLTVHDPYNVLHAERDPAASDKGTEKPKKTVSSQRIDPWPFDRSDPSKPPPYETHTYELQLTQKSLDEVNHTREELLASRSSEPESLCYIYPSKEEGPTNIPLIRIMVPSRPPKPVQTEEAHLFLSKYSRKGEGNHSFVYEAEWEIPRELFVDPKICYACVEAKAKQVWVEQKNVESSPKQALRAESARVVDDPDPGDDVVLPEMDDEQLRAYLAELEAQLDPVLTTASTAPASSPPTPAPAAPDYLDPEPARIASCGLPLQTCKTWQNATTTTHPAILPNCGTVWAEALRIPGAPTTTFHARSLDEVTKENRQKAQEARDRGEKKEWVYSEDVTESMKQKFEEDRIMALGPGEDLRKKEEEELERRRSSAMDVDSETNTAEIGGTFEAPCALYTSLPYPGYFLEIQHARFMAVSTYSHLPLTLTNPISLPPR